MILGIDIWLVALCLFVVMAGAALQASIGIGMGLLAAPLLGLIDPAFVPGAIVVTVVPLSVGMALRERHHIDRRGIGWAILGRLPGVVLGAWLAAAAGHDAIAVVIGVSVLVAVAASLTRVHFAPSDRNLFIAGTTSGFTGTAAGIGGPPMALTYQHSDPRTLRATLAAFFTVGAAMSITSLVITGVLGWHEFQLGVLLIPAVLVGLVISQYTVARLPAERVRPIVLAVCAASAVSLLMSRVV